MKYTAINIGTIAGAVLALVVAVLKGDPLLIGTAVLALIAAFVPSPLPAPPAPGK